MMKMEKNEIKEVKDFFMANQFVEVIYIDKIDLSFVNFDSVILRYMNFDIDDSDKITYNHLNKKCWVSLKTEEINKREDFFEVLELLRERYENKNVIIIYLFNNLFNNLLYYSFNNFILTRLKLLMLNILIKFLNLNMSQKKIIDLIE